MGRLLVSVGLDNKIKIHSDHAEHKTIEEREGFILYKFV